MRNREHLGCLRVREGVITLEKMYFADEIRPIDEIAPRNVKVAKEELEMAADLIDRFTTWKPEAVQRHVPGPAARGDQGEEEGQGGHRRGGRRSPRRRRISSRRSGRASRLRRSDGARRARTSRRSARRSSSRRKPSRRYARHAGGFLPGPMIAGDEIDALYALPLDEFTRARNELARKLAEGRSPRRGGRGLGPPEADAPGVGRQSARPRAALGGRAAARRRRGDQGGRRGRGRALPRERSTRSSARRVGSWPTPAGSRPTRCSRRSRRRSARPRPRRRRSLRRAG